MTLVSSLTNRIFLASALLVVVSIGITMYRVHVSVAAQAEADLRAGLADAALLVNEFSRTAFQDFVVKSQLIADLPVLRGAAATDDPPTVAPIARDYQTTIGADLFVVVSRGGRVLARAGRIQLDDAAIAGMLEACRTSRDGTVFWPFADGVLHVAAFPMDAGLSTLVVGQSLDREAALRIRAVTNSEIAFVAGSSVVASTLDPSRRAVLAATATREDVFTVPLGDEMYIGRVQPLGPPGEAGPVALVLRSRTEHLKFLPLLHRQIAVTALAAVLVSTLVGYLVARTVTRPLRALTGTMREMAATGDLTRSLPTLRRWDDEDVRLVATTFRQLTSALDRFQREASLRERLSSLGRLSAVIAHEIRNPLMNIKSAVRNLRRHASPDAVAMAASIDEEVARLNQVVTGVLDFARPIEFNAAPADLGDICRDAARAAQALAEDVPVTVDLVDVPAVTVVDAERLRAGLVNVLSNAQQAVRARDDRRRGDPDITLQLTRASQDRWRIDVIDRGIGIPADDLPRIFDPFFTTRRGGSGLGLAIVRNVVEGMGGTIVVDSRIHKGTTVRIELPHRAAPVEVPA